MMLSMILHLGKSLGRKARYVNVKYGTNVNLQIYPCKILNILVGYNMRSTLAHNGAYEGDHSC